MPLLLLPLAHLIHLNPIKGLRTLTIVGQPPSFVCRLLFFHSVRKNSFVFSEFAVADRHFKWMALFARPFPFNYYYNDDLSIKLRSTLSAVSVFRHLSRRRLFSMSRERATLWVLPQESNENSRSTAARPISHFRTPVDSSRWWSTLTISSLPTLPS